MRAFHAALLKNPPPRGGVIRLLQPLGFQLMGTAGARAARVWFDDPGLDTEVLQVGSADFPPRPSLYLRFDPERRTFTSLPEALIVETVRSDRAIARGDYAEAGRALERALPLVPAGTLDSERIPILYNAGAVAALAGDTATAMRRYLEAHALAPDHTSAMLGVADLLHGAGRLDQARAWIDRALASSPDDPKALIQRVALEHESGDSAAARNTWMRLVAIHPHFVDSLMRAGPAPVGASGPR